MGQINVRAVWLAAAAYFTLSTSDVMVRSISGTYPVATIIFFNMLFAFIPCSIYARAHGGMAVFRPRKLPLLVLTGLIGAVGVLVFFTGITKMPMGDMYAIAFANPLFSTLLTMLFLGERFSLDRGLALLAGFAAIVFMIQPGPNILGQVSLYPLGAALCFAMTTVINRYVGRFNKPPTLMLVNNIVVMLGMVAMGQLTGFVIPAWADIPHFLLNGIVGGLGQCLILAAICLGPTIRVVPVMFTQILWGSLYGYLLWGEVPGHTILVGAPILIVAIMYIVRHPARRLAPVVAEKPPEVPVGGGVLPQPEICFRPETN